MHVTVAYCKDSLTFHLESLYKTMNSEKVTSTEYLQYKAGCDPGLSQMKYGQPIQATYPGSVVWMCNDANL